MVIWICLTKISQIFWNHIFIFKFLKKSWVQLPLLKMCTQPNLVRIFFLLEIMFPDPIEVAPTFVIVKIKKGQIWTTLLYSIYFLLFYILSVATFSCLIDWLCIQLAVLLNNSLYYWPCLWLTVSTISCLIDKPSLLLAVLLTNRLYN